MNVLVTGSSGLIGSALVRELAARGHRAVRLVRGREAGEGEARWDPAAGTVDTDSLEGLDAVIHLAGESVVGRWTAAKRRRIRDSRIGGTKLLCEALTSLNRPPRTLLCASATGWYGDRGDEIVTEQSGRGEGFLADVCGDREAAAASAAEAGIRVVSMRFGVVLSRAGGALAKMLPPFRLGLGGRIGNGRQYMPWVSLADTVAAVCHLLAADHISGPVNVVAPNPVTNRAFTKALGRTLHRPTILPLPAPAARLLFGRMAREILLSGARVHPERLLADGFCFQHSDLDAALHAILSPKQRA